MNFAILSLVGLRQETVKFSLRYEDVPKRKMPFNKSARNEPTKRNGGNTAQVLARFL